MDNIKFSNNVSVKLAALVAAADTTITTQALPTGITWPNLTPVPATINAQGTALFVLKATDTGGYWPSRVAASVDAATVVADYILGRDGQHVIEPADSVDQNTGMVLTPNGTTGLAISARVRVSAGQWWSSDAGNENSWQGFNAASFPFIVQINKGYYNGTEYVPASGLYIIKAVIQPDDTYTYSVQEFTPRDAITLVPQTVAQVIGGYVDGVSVTVDPWFYVTLMQIETGKWEICKCTAYTQNTDDTWTLTVERAQEGSVATDFTDAAIVENRVTAGTLDSMVQAINDQIFITDVISQEQLQDVLNVVGAIDEIGSGVIQDILDTANEAVDTANEAVATANQAVNNANSLAATVNAAKNAAEAAAIEAGNFAAQAEDCQEASCECASESATSADEADASATAAIAANEAAQEALAQFRNLGVGLNVMQIDPDTETFVVDPDGVDPVSVASTVQSLILDIDEGDYALTLSDVTMEVPGTVPDTTVTKSTVAMYKGTAAGPGTYTGPLCGIYREDDNTDVLSADATVGSVTAVAVLTGVTVEEFDANNTFYSISPTISSNKVTVPIKYIKIGLSFSQSGASDGDVGLLLRTSGGVLNGRGNAYVYKNGDWQLVVGDSLSNVILLYAAVDALGTGPGYIVLDVNAATATPINMPVGTPTVITNTIQNINIVLEDTHRAISYAAWSMAELPTNGIADGIRAIVPGATQDQILIYRFLDGSWQRKALVFDPSAGVASDTQFLYISTDAFGQGPGFVACGMNKWTQVTIDTPSNVTQYPLEDGTVTQCSGTTIGSGLPEWTYVKNLPIDNLTIFSVSKPFDGDGNGYYWFRNTWNRLDFTGTGAIKSVDGIMADDAYNAQLKYSVSKSEFESLQEAGTLVRGARYLVAEEGQTSSSIDNGVPLFSIIDSVISTVPIGYLDVGVDNGLLTQAMLPDAYQQLVNLQNAGDTQILSLDDYNTAVTSGGCCRKFGLDTGTQTFRVPYIPLKFWYGQTMLGPIISTMAYPAVSISSGFFSPFIATDDCFVTCYGVNNGGAATSNLNIYVDGVRVDNAYSSGEIFVSSYVRKGQKVKFTGGYLQAQPGTIVVSTSGAGNYAAGIGIQSITAPLSSHFIKVYGAVSDAGVLNLTQLVTTKANRGDGFPSNSYIDLPVPASNVTLPSPGDGWILWVHHTSASDTPTLVCGLLAQTIVMPSAQGINMSLPISKSAHYVLVYNNIRTPVEDIVRFIPAIGSN